MDTIKTSDRLEKIVEGFELRIFEIVTGFSDESRVLRFDFSAKDDSGKLCVAGSTGQLFENNESPREVANKLRTMADELDKYWARAFPTDLDAQPDKIT